MSAYQDLQRYVGREYREDYNCAHLAADVQHDARGVRLPLPGVMPCGVAGQRSVINSMRDELATPLAAPRDLCAVLLSSRDDHGREVLHIGTVALRGAEPYVLHNSAYFGGARFESLADLQRMGMHFRGWFEWKT